MFGTQIFPEIGVRTPLPPGLNAFHASGNRFCGSVDLLDLPEEITEIKIAGNAFTGLVDLTEVPGSEICVLDLSNNRFTSIGYSIKGSVKGLDVTGNPITTTLHG